jgi:hypothetical protein
MCMRPTLYVVPWYRGWNGRRQITRRCGRGTSFVSVHWTDQDANDRWFQWGTQALQMSGGRDCGQTDWQRQLSYRIEMAGPQTDSGGDAANEAH